MPKFDNYQLLENTALSDKLEIVQQQLRLLATASPKEDKRVKEILNLTNGIRVNIEDIVKCRSLEYKSSSPRIRSRTTTRRTSPDVSRVMPMREPMPIRTRHGRDPYDASRYIDPMAPRK